MSKHHNLFPPSASERWLHCTASVMAIDALSKADEESEYAAEGTLAHWVFAEVLIHDVVQSSKSATLTPWATTA